MAFCTPLGKLMIFEAVPLSFWKLPARKVGIDFLGGILPEAPPQVSVRVEDISGVDSGGEKEANAGIERSLFFLLGYHPSGFRNQSAAFGDKIGPFPFQVFLGEQD